jgi:thioredoxin reductase (NADPH)
MATPTKIGVAGHIDCPAHLTVKQALLGLQALLGVEVEVEEFDSKERFDEWLAANLGRFGPRAAGHSTAPLVWMQGDDYIGGQADAMAFLKAAFMSGGNAHRRLRATHDNDVLGASAGSGGGGDTAMEDTATEFDHDLIVIGGGSGGLACGKEAAALGANVLLLDLVKPSPQGTTWGLGGTCVNVGCIPKKLMHTAALMGEHVNEDAKAFGWTAEGVKHDWETMVQAVNDHVRSLNFGYRVQLREKGITYKNALGKITGPHTVELTTKKGKKSTVTGRRIVIAVGGRPTMPDMPGVEHALSSDDLFSLATPPGKTLVVGASYVALECAGFMSGLGYDVSVAVRSVVLRGFDREMATDVVNGLKEHGTNLLMKVSPLSIEKNDEGRLAVTLKDNESGETRVEVFDTVFMATGRAADTSKLGLDSVGVKTDAKGKIVCVNEQTSVPHIYAIGDVVAGVPELTPVAIQSGKLLARRLFGDDTTAMNYDKVATTVFTPIEYGAIGLTEEDARAKYGEERVDVYHSVWDPLEWTVPHKSVRAHAKVIVDLEDDERVLGMHYFGPNAGEIIQGYAVAVLMGATYRDLADTVGIHPTVSEEFTTMTARKSAGDDPAKSGC